MSDEDNAKSSATSAHFDNEIDIAGLKAHKWRTSSRRSTTSSSPTGKRIILLAGGPPGELGCGTGHPSYVMSSSFPNQVLAQIELFTHTPIPGGRVHPAEAARRESRAPAARQARRDAHELTDEQAKYIGVAKSGAL